MSYLSKCMTSPERLWDMEKIAREVSSIMKEVGLTHWLDSGTLLGAYRFASHMPFDDDVDFGVLESEYFNLKDSLEKKLNEAGYETKYNHISDIYHVFYKSDNGRAQVDLFLFRPTENPDRLRLVSDSFHPHAKHGDGKPGFDKNLIFNHGNLGEGQLLGVKFPVPANIKGYLNQWYPEPEIFTSFMVTQNHASGYCREHSVAIPDIRKCPTCLEKMLEHLTHVYGDKFVRSEVPLYAL